MQMPCLLLCTSPNPEPSVVPSCQQARMLELLVRLLELPTNLDYLLGSGPLLPGFAKAMLAALDHCNSLDSDEPAMMTGGEAVSRLSVLLQVRRRGNISQTELAACCLISAEAHSAGTSADK